MKLACVLSWKKMQFSDCSFTYSSLGVPLAHDTEPTNIYRNSVNRQIFRTIRTSSNRTTCNRPPRTNNCRNSKLISASSSAIAMAAGIEVNASQWRLVEVGRVVLFTHGKYLGRLAVIVEIIDHKRVNSPASISNITFPCSFESQVLVDGPSKKENASVPRHATSLSNLIITPIVIPKLPRGAGRGAVAKAWEKEGVESKWAESTWAKRRAQREKRKALSDFERFKVLRLKKQVRELLLWVQHTLFVQFHNPYIFLPDAVWCLRNLRGSPLGKI